MKEKTSTKFWKPLLVVYKMVEYIINKHLKMIYAPCDIRKKWNKSSNSNSNA
jgi:hypothetical protein